MRPFALPGFLFLVLLTAGPAPAQEPPIGAALHRARRAKFAGAMEGGIAIVMSARKNQDFISSSPPSRKRPTTLEPRSTIPRGGGSPARRCGSRAASTRGFHKRLRGLAWRGSAPPPRRWRDSAESSDRRGRWRTPGHNPPASYELRAPPSGERCRDSFRRRPPPDLAVPTPERWPRCRRQNRRDSECPHNAWSRAGIPRARRPDGSCRRRYLPRDDTGGTKKTSGEAPP